MKTLEITLCAIPYRVTEQDCQIIFEEQSGFDGSFSRFVLEWKGFGWYFVGYEDRFDRIYVAHIAAAYEWIRENYAETWANGVGTVTLKPRLNDKS